MALSKERSNVPSSDNRLRTQPSQASSDSLFRPWELSSQSVPSPNPSSPSKEVKQRNSSISSNGLKREDRANEPNGHHFSHSSEHHRLIDASPKYACRPLKPQAILASPSSTVIPSPSFRKSDLQKFSSLSLRQECSPLSINSMISPSHHHNELTASHFGYKNFQTGSSASSSPTGTRARHPDHPFFPHHINIPLLHDSSPTGPATITSSSPQKYKRKRPKRFQCPHCHVSFSNNGQLRGHIRTHTGESFSHDLNCC